MRSVELANLVLNPGANLATADQSRVREIRLIAQAWEQYSSGSRPTVH